MKIFIKNMVCNRCIIMVKSLIESSDLNVVEISLGEVNLKENLTPEQLNSLENKLKPLGFNLIDDKKAQMIERIKTAIINLVHHSEKHTNVNLSALLTKDIHYDYNYISNLFSAIEGKTIEKYYILQKIEKAKELLVYNELSISQIAQQLNYSSVAHLSSQFKKTTGLTPSHFKKIKENKREPLDNL